MNRPRILLTGATGFVGRHLAASLLSAGEHLTLAVRDRAACPADWRDHERVSIVEVGPLETAANLDGAFASVSRVVHAAGFADVDGTDAIFAANVDATRLLVDKAATTNVATFIYISSVAAVSGNASQVVLADDTIPSPVTSYGQSKRMAEDHVAGFAAQGRFAVSLRPPLVVGAGAKGNWRALLRLAKTGAPLPFASVRNRRSLIDVEELARAVVILCAHDWPTRNSGNYCIANEGTVSLAEIVTELRAGMGMRPRLFPCPPSFLYGLARATSRQRAAAGLLGDLVVDASRFRQTFGLAQARDLKAAIRASAA